MGVTFQPNKTSGIHWWYPFIEGFSGEFVSDMLDEFGGPSGTVFDPFGGCGTTALVANLRRLDSVITDINPFMCFVTRAKTNRYRTTHLKPVGARLRRAIESYNPRDAPSDALSFVFADKDYFNEDAIGKIRFLKDRIRRIRNGTTYNFFALALASILVKVSRLKRAPDLKYKPKNATSTEVFAAFLEQVARMEKDVAEVEHLTMGTTAVMCDNITAPSALTAKYNDSFDVVITSPPYLNGTNYCRNTKLELWIFDYLTCPNDLRELRKQSISASINSTQMRNGTSSKFPEVERLVGKIQANAYDRRIPVMVASYFNEMEAALRNICRVLKRGHYCILVIGDSFFGDTHVPTDVILGRISDDAGFSMMDRRIVRVRKSRGGFPLHESILILRKRH